MTVAGRHTAPPPARRIWGTVEAADRLDASAVVRCVRRQHPEAWARWAGSGEPVLVPVVAPLTRNGLAAGAIAPLVVGLDGARGMAGFPNGPVAALEAKPANLPGGRGAGFVWLWRCPLLDRPCAALFRPRSAIQFGSREGHGLHHQAACKRPAERALRKVRKIRARLGEEGPAALGSPPPPRPLRMRAHTYVRLLAALHAAEDHARARLAGMAARRWPAGV